MANLFSFTTQKNTTPPDLKRRRTRLGLIFNPTDSELNTIDNSTERYAEKIGNMEFYNKATSSKVNPISNSNTGVYNAQKISREEYLKKEANQFFSILRNDYVEAGYYSSSELYLKSKLQEEPMVVKSLLNTFFYENLSSPEMLVKLLHIISDIDYDIMKPEGPIIAMAAATHNSDEVNEYAIRVFEKWANTESLTVLKNMRFHEEWLQEYANEVITDLEEELS
ncbi:hypothetical protein ACQVPY_13755 [Bacillus pretiosus]|uniref:hypothetical protein n=1 Tax=Bacillus pretiosus TaxID=2983392 RepID=UPI003D650B59